MLAACDAVIVGSALKTDGKWWNPLDSARMGAFLRAARG
jgi:predicted TIM-barrel enzyme